MLKLTSYKALQLMDNINKNGNKQAYSKRIAFLYRTYKEGIINQEEYLNQYNKSLVAFGQI